MKPFFAIVILFLLFVPVDTNAQIITTIAGTATFGFSGDGGPATLAQLQEPQSVFVDGSGNVFVSDWGNDRVRRIYPSGIISTVAGGGSSGLGDGGQATAARLIAPRGAYTDSSGNMYIMDYGNDRIRLVNTFGIINTIVGNGTVGFSGNGGLATAAELWNSPRTCMDGSGNLYVADNGNNGIRIVNPSGIINTFAGMPRAIGFSGDGGQATGAKLANPMGVCLDAIGNLYIADQNNNRIRKVDPSGVITTVAGNGTAGYSADGIPAISSELSEPASVAIDGAGNLYIADRNNNRIRMVNKAGIISTIAGTGVAGFSGDGGPSTAAQLYFPMDVCVDGSGNIYIADDHNNRIRKICQSVVPATISGLSTICGHATIYLSATVSGGRWSAINGHASVLADTGAVSGITAGVDTITYTQIGCTTVNTYFTVTVTALPVVGVILGADSLCVGATTILTDTTGGGIWSSSNSKASIAGGLVTALVAGIDTFSYTFTNSCGSISATHSVTINALPGTGVITGDSSLCPGTTITLSDAIKSGTWASISVGGGIVATITMLGIVSGISSGMDTIKYTVTSKSCSVAAIKIITVSSRPDSGTIIGPSGACIGSTVTLTDASPSGVWSSGNTGIAMVSGGVVTCISTGVVNISYSVTGLCGTSIAIHSFTVSTLPDPGTITGNTNVCIGETLTLKETVAGGAWHSANNTAAVTASGIVTGMSAGTDTIQYTITNIGCSATTTKIITVDPLPDAGTITGQNTICIGASVSFVESVSGGKWSSSNTTIVGIGDTTGVLHALTIGVTTISYTTAPDINGCTNATSFTETIITSHLIISGAISKITCYGSNNGSIAASVNGGTGNYQYTWSNGDSLSQISALTPGSYSLQVKDRSTQCTTEDSFAITQSDSLVVTAEVRNDTCYEGHGNIGIIVSGGTGPYHYLWSNNATIGNISGLLPGAYTLTVTDSDNCKKNLPVSIGDTCVDVVVHDVITPNGDGINDTWVIVNIQDYPQNTVQVFDKWGNIVYSKEAYNNDWSGRGNSGEQLPDGAYFYLVKLNTANAGKNKNVFTGAILIKR